MEAFARPVRTVANSLRKSSTAFSIRAFPAALASFVDPIVDMVLFPQSKYGTTCVFSKKARLCPEPLLGPIFCFYLQRQNLQLPHPVVTFEPTRSPCTTRLIFPYSPMLNTTIGIPLSMHSEIAVESITFKFRCRTS